MIKSVTFLFPLCILLLSGYLQQQEYSFYEFISTPSLKNVNCFTLQTHHYSISSFALSNKKEQQKQTHITDIEEKENETVSFKSHVGFSNNINTRFYTQITEYFFQYIQIHLSFFKRFSYFLSCESLYLLFEVMRI